MSDPDGVFLYLAAYEDEAAARADYDVVKALHDVSAIGAFDAAVITKDDKGKVHVNKDETSTRHGAWGGAAVGALVGILFPPSIIVSAAVGAGVGGATGHLWKGMSRSDVKEIGDFLDSGQAALLVIGEATLSEALQKAELHAVKEMRKELNANAKELEKAIKAGDL